jgi:hypothetical protein
LTSLRVYECWLINSILARKLKYYGHIKRHNCLERNIVGGMVPGRGGLRRRWFQDIRETLNMTLEEVSILETRILSDRL